MKDYTKPKARMDKLVINQLPDELLVYDLKSHKAYCLNATAAAVWNLCDGSQTTTQLATKLATKSTSEAADAANEAIVNLALDELEKFNLLESSMDSRAEKPPVKKLITRRDAVRALGAATVLLPAITMIVAPTAAQTGSLKPNGASCALSDECASGCCDPVESVCAPIEDCGARGVRIKRQNNR